MANLETPVLEFLKYLDPSGLQRLFCEATRKFSFSIRKKKQVSILPQWFPIYPKRSLNFIHCYPLLAFILYLLCLCPESKNYDLHFWPPCFFMFVTSKIPKQPQNNLRQQCPTTSFLFITHHDYITIGENWPPFWPYLNLCYLHLSQVTSIFTLITSQQYDQEHTYKSRTF